MTTTHTHTHTNTSIYNTIFSCITVQTHVNVKAKSQESENSRDAFWLLKNLLETLFQNATTQVDTRQFKI